ncbi:MAG: hypothetical protein JW984_06285 [Deltaproteobacteria bacterium]|uniref:Uncharacterized protein n=1 Tax=Candidatus Zymogenus saltonus TaxID=2844893 RepID=A0A9D8KF21_9DELT|nr:hypothetical protein [Candidatus Zymogenus saltonus]
MKKIIVISLCILFFIIIILAAVGCARPILPGSCVEIVYPGPDMVVPTDFSILGVAAKWSLGLEVNPLLFLISPKSYVHMSSSSAELFVDGTPYAVSSGGNHHLFRLTLSEGDHTLLLYTPFGQKEIIVHVTKTPAISFDPFHDADRIVKTTDQLKLALYEYLKSNPLNPSDNEGGYEIQRIFPIDSGAFIATGVMEGQILNECKIIYVDLSGRPPTANAVSKAPVVFSWNKDKWDGRVVATSEGAAGDRLFLTVLDDASLSVFSIFPDGKVASDRFELGDISPEFFDSVTKAIYSEIRTRGNHDFLHIRIDGYRPNDSPRSFDLVVSGSTAKEIDLGGYDVEGIGPNGELIAFYPAPFTGPFDTMLFDKGKPTKAYYPLPSLGKTFSFFGGSVHDINKFRPERPLFEVAPPVPCVGCNNNYIPAHHGAFGDITFGPDVLKTSLAGREGYFVMKYGGK